MSIKKSWRKANRRHDILEELIQGGDTQIYNTLFRWIKSGKIDRKDFVGIMRHIEIHGLNLYDDVPPSPDNGSDGSDESVQENPCEPDVGE